MLRNVTLEDISDGKLYTENDLVKTDTNSCVGCKTVCCQNMGNTIVLDPRDMFDLVRAKGASANALLETELELNVVDGLILPNLKMQDGTGRCAFLDENNRCKIHTARPGICRMFPLGRYWEDDTHFKYILQKGECNKDGLTKIKVKKWLGIEGLQEYNAFVVSWHAFIKELQRALDELDEQQKRILNTFVLKMFYLTEYNSRGVEEFYREFEARLADAREKLGLN